MSLTIVGERKCLSSRRESSSWLPKHSDWRSYITHVLHSAKIKCPHRILTVRKMLFVTSFTWMVYCLFTRSPEEGSWRRKRFHCIKTRTKHLRLPWNVPESSNNPEHQIQICKNQGTHPGIWGVLRGLVTKGALCWARGKWCHATNGVNDLAWRGHVERFSSFKETSCLAFAIKSLF